MRKKEAHPKKLDISFGPFVQSGFERPKFDFQKYPYPLKDGTAEEIYCAYYFNRIPGKGRPAFMDELWRILVPKGKLTIIVPYWSSPRAIQDFTHEWPPVVEQSFLYFNKEWRKQNWLSDYPMKCDFDFVYGYGYEQECGMKSDETKSFWVKRYINAINDLQVTLTRKSA